jgi:hypothetical protein
LLIKVQLQVQGRHLQMQRYDLLQVQGRHLQMQRRDLLQLQGRLLQIPEGLYWLHTQRGHELPQTSFGYWLQTLEGRGWLQTPGGRYWLQTERGQEWLQTSHGQAWQSTPAASVWLTMEEFSGTLDEIRGYMVVTESSLLPAFQAVQQFGDLPDFLMFPAFLALSLRYQDHSASALPQVSFPSNMEVIHAMKAFVEFAKETQEQSRTASDALNYACQNWSLHLSRAPEPWDGMLNHLFKSFWNGHLLSWLERQWCLKDLRSCLVILSEGQKLAQVCARPIIVGIRNLTSAYGIVVRICQCQQTVINNEQHLLMVLLRGRLIGSYPPRSRVVSLSQ